MIDARLPPARIHAFANCGTSHWIMRHKDDPDRFKIVPDHCHDRFCVPCGGSRQAVIRRNLHVHLRNQPHRFLTLTIRHHDETLATLLLKLYRGFRRLRQRTLWRERVRGGVAFLELTYAPDRNSWHPHLHCMLDGDYIDLQDLSRAWLAATGDSKSVKIQYIRDPATVTRYITKYATKPLPASVLRHHAALVEAIHALNARRTVITFGSWRNWRLLSDPEDHGWQLFDHINAVRIRAHYDDPLAMNILAMICTADPHTGEFYVHVQSDHPP